MPGGAGTGAGTGDKMRRRSEAAKKGAAGRKQRIADEIERTGPAQTYEAHMGSGTPGLPEFRKGIDKIKPITGPSSTAQQGPMPTPGASAIYAQQGSQGMWGAFSASRSHSRPRTF